jgi:hypothetical protein
VAHDFEQTADDASGSEVPETQGDRRVAMNNPMTIYLVTAYRWGASNRHQYQVYAGVDKTKAIALAANEVNDRAGKYDCVVYEFTADGVDYKPIAYVPAYDSTEERIDARHDHYRDYLEKLGSFMAEAAEGRALLPSPEDPGRLTYQTIELPEAFKAEVARQRKTLELYQRAETGGSPPENAPSMPV